MNDANISQYKKRLVNVLSLWPQLFDIQRGLNVGLWSIAYWNRGFESSRGHACHYLTSVVCLCDGHTTRPKESYQAWYDLNASELRRPKPTRAVEPWKHTKKEENRQDIVRMWVYGWLRKWGCTPRQRHPPRQRYVYFNYTQNSQFVVNSATYCNQMWTA
jgi:hypothetical protein